VALTAEVGGKPVAIVATSPAAREAGANAGALAKAMAAVLGGGGGGKPDLAQGGGSDLTAIPAALDAVRRELVR
jgi:alanyl-tRNA synthetase